MFHRLRSGPSYFVFLAIIVALATPASAKNNLFVTGPAGKNVGLPPTSSYNWSMREVIGFCKAFRKCTVAGPKGKLNKKQINRIEAKTGLKHIPSNLTDRSTFRVSKRGKK
jgi:hypothetical protein